MTRAKASRWLFILLLTATSPPLELGISWPGTPGIRVAHAQQRQRTPRARHRLARQLLHRGLSRMALGQYAEAAEDFQASYRFQPLSRTLFLRGQSLELAGELEQAAGLYQRLLEKRARGIDHAVVAKRLEQLKEQLEKATPIKPAKPDKVEEPETAKAAAPTDTATSPSEETFADGTESLGEPEDDDDLSAWRPGETPQSRTKAASQAELPVRYAANALLRLAMDTRHEGAAPRRPPEDVQELYGQATGTIHYRPRDWARLVVSGQILYRLTWQRGPGDEGFWGHTNRHTLEPRLQDTFAEVSTSWIDAAAGMMTTVWGVNDLVNPNDVLSAKDLRNGPPVDPQAIRFASPTVKADVYLGRLTLSAVWQPLFLPDKIDVFGSDFALFGPAAPEQFAWLGSAARALVDDSLAGEAQALLLQTHLPRPVTQSAAATRVALSLGGWDLAAQYAFTLTPRPVYRIEGQFLAALLPILIRPDPTLTPEELRLVGQILTVSKLRPLDARYRHFHQTGLSAVTSFWKLVTSVDLSYRVGVPLQLGGAQPMIPLEGGAWWETTVTSDVASGTLGLRYTYGDELLLSLEAWYELHVDIARMDKSARPELLFGGPHRAGTAFLGRYAWTRADLVFEVTVLAELVQLGYVVVPKITYRVGDHLHVFAGANLFGGETGTTGGAFKANDMIFFGLQGYL